jgi:hypothetical protein
VVVLVGSTPLARWYGGDAGEKDPDNRGRLGADMRAVARLKEVAEKASNRWAIDCYLCVVRGSKPIGLALRSGGGAANYGSGAQSQTQAHLPDRRVTLPCRRAVVGRRKNARGSSCWRRRARWVEWR